MGHRAVRGSGEALKELGIDLIDASSGALMPKARIPVGKGYQVPFARRIRTEAKIMTGAVGLITEAGHANEIITGGDADLVFIARTAARAVLGAQGPNRIGPRAILADPIRLRRQATGEVISPPSRRSARTFGSLRKGRRLLLSSLAPFVRERPSLCKDLFRSDSEIMQANWNAAARAIQSAEETRAGRASSALSFSRRRSGRAKIEPESFNRFRSSVHGTCPYLGANSGRVVSGRAPTHAGGP